ncbi:MAG: lipoprotein [Hyphomicrobiaceae bacterium]
MNACVRICTIWLAVAFATAVAGCGVRGSLEYPKTAETQKNTATASSGQGKPQGAAPKAHQGFILDGLLR